MQLQHFAVLNKDIYVKRKLLPPLIRLESCLLLALRCAAAHSCELLEAAAAAARTSTADAAVAASLQQQRRYIVSVQLGLVFGAYVATFAGGACT